MDVDNILNLEVRMCIQNDLCNASIETYWSEESRH